MKSRPKAASLFDFSRLRAAKYSSSDQDLGPSLTATPGGNCSLYREDAELSGSAALSSNGKFSQLIQ